MVRNIFLFSLWGYWVLHCQIVVCAFLTTWLPQGAGWNVVFFFLFLIVMAVNIGMNYLWAVSKWFGDETVMDAFIVGVALLALMTFVASALGVKLHYHYHAQFTEVETVENCPTHLKTGGFYRFPNAVIAHSFTYQDRWKHYAQAQGQSPKGYLVAYKITPLRCDSNPVYHLFIAYNDRDQSLQHFDNQSVMIIPYYSQHRDTYLKILPILQQKFGIQISTKPVLLEQIDLNAFKASQKKHFWIFYSILLGFLGYFNVHHSVYTSAYKTDFIKGA